MEPGAVVMTAGAAMVAASIIPVFRSPEGLLDTSTYKRLWAAGLLTLFLSAMADILPQVTVPLALSLILLVIVKSGLFGKTTTANTKPISPTSASQAFQAGYSTAVDSQAFQKGYSAAGGLDTNPPYQQP
jgi:hypothetical protein